MGVDHVMWGTTRLVRLAASWQIEACAGLEIGGHAEENGFATIGDA